MTTMKMAMKLDLYWAYDEFSLGLGSYLSGSRQRRTKDRRAPDDWVNRLCCNHKSIDSIDVPKPGLQGSGFTYATHGRGKEAP